MKAYGVIDQMGRCAELKKIGLSPKDDQNEVRVFSLTSLRIGDTHLYFKLAGINSIEEMGQFSGFSVYCRKTDLPDIVVGGFGYRQLENALASDLSGQEIGKIVDLVYNSGQYLLIVNGIDNQEVMIPWLEGTVLKIEEGVIFLDFPEGLLELNKLKKKVNLK